MTNHSDGLAPQVNIDELVATYSSKIDAARTRLLRVPSKAKSRIPSLTVDEVAILEQLTREMLESIAATSSGDQRIDSLFARWRPLVTDMPESPEEEKS